MIRKENYGSNYILVYAIIQILLNSICDYIDFVDGNNYMYYYINQVLTLITLGFLFKSLLSQKKILSDFFFIICVISSLFYSDNITNSFASFPFGILSVFIIINSLYYFKIKFSNVELNYLYANKSFWYVAGLFIYFSSNFLIFISYNNLISKSETINYAYILWLFHNLIFTLMFIIFSLVELWPLFQKRFN
ncbi:hypothetical protein EGI26_01795 [Lacihabitans sp. CCS-44]|nr:hypothetical protein [Lacihabitans sp. CCS-44]